MAKSKQRRQLEAIVERMRCFANEPMPPSSPLLRKWAREIEQAARTLEQEG
ncbi:hypothetical protein ACOBR2_06550 [Telmatobacter bradus]|uniref:hypothetical protein n=1 Tax=Telmatobacter bradus TaxID=474953 RepID=UPI003B434394